MKWLIYLGLLCTPALAQYPVTDAFSGTGGLGASYTCGTNAGITISKSSGILTASAGGTSAYANCGRNTPTFTFFGVTNMYAEIVDPTGSPNSGPALLDGSNNGYGWSLASKLIEKITAGFPTGVSGFVCPFTAANDVAALTIQGTTLSCVDVTLNGDLQCPSPTHATAYCGQVTDSTFTPTQPGVIIGAGLTLKGPLVADCFPATCGTLPSPTPSVAPSGASPPTTGPIYANFPNITPTLPASSIGCYTLDGSTPTASGTTFLCTHGTTYTSGTIALNQGSGGSSATTTIKILATSATNSAMSAVVTWIYVLEGVQNVANQQSMGWQLLANGQVELNSFLNFCTACTVTANISGNFGGATGTLDSTASGNSIRTLTVGNTAGTCTANPVYPNITSNAVGGPVTSFNLVSGGSGWPASSTFPFEVTQPGFGLTLGTFTTNSSGVAVSTAVTSGGSGWGTGTIGNNWNFFPFSPLKITSTAGFNVNFVSDDDATVIATFPISVCANTTDVEMFPFYATRYASQPLEIQAMTTGTASPQVTWSITAQPGGGDGVLDPSPQTACETAHSCYTTIFKATVAGRYSVQACNAIETSACRTTTVFVTGNALPFNVTPNGTEPNDPTTDPYGAAHGGTVYDVGPSQTHTTINSIDFRTLNAGDTVRIHNEGANGSPTSYPEMLQLINSGTEINPIRIVGVPNASGELPVLEGSNAVAPSWFSTVVDGGIVTSWVPGCSLVWGARDAGSCGPSWIVFENLRMQNARPGFNNILPGFGTIPWPSGSMGLNIHDGFGWAVRGNDFYNNSMCIGSFTPANPRWGGVTQVIDMEGNNCHQYGGTGGDASIDHGFYVQSYGEKVAYNWIHDQKAGSGGSGIKTRSFQFTIEGNYIDCTSGLCGRFIDHVDVQDAATWFGLDNYYCVNGDCTTSFPNAYASAYNGGNGFGPTVPGGITPDIMAGYQAASRINWDVGNIFNGVMNANAIHYAGDEAIAATTMRGTLHLLNNSSLGTRFWLDVDGGGVSSLAQPEYPFFDMQNNIVDASTGTGNFAVAGAMNVLGTFGKNLWRQGIIDVTNPITGCNPASNCGWDGAVSFYSTAAQWLAYTPVQVHMTGINTTEFLFTPTNTSPVNSSTLIPNPSGGAISAGVALTGDAANFPQRSQFVPSLMYTTPRTRLLDLGALDGSGVTVTPTVIVYDGKVYKGKIQ